jgi:hypothetical protein
MCSLCDIEFFNDPIREIQMKKIVKIGDDHLPEECPKCEGTDLSIDNVEGLECLECGCWFDTEENGQVIWARASRPADIDFI